MKQIEYPQSFYFVLFLNVLARVAFFFFRGELDMLNATGNITLGQLKIATSSMAFCVFLLSVWLVLTVLLRLRIIFKDEA